MRRAIVAVLALTLTACGGDRDGRVDFGGDELGPDVYAVTSEDGNVKMGLTAAYVYFALSDTARAHAEAELDEEAGEGFFGGIMRNLVGRALSFRAKYAVTEIEDVRWEDGRLRLVFTDPDRTMDPNFQMGEDESVQDSFSREAVESFGEAFRALKAEAAAQAEP